jgi:hypothetical protein
MKKSNSNQTEVQSENGKVVDQAKGDFDISRLRLSQDFHQGLAVKKIITTVPVRKPGPQDFFRVHPGEEMYLQTFLFEEKDQREFYLVDPSLWECLANDLVPTLLHVTITRHGVVGIWPHRLPRGDGRGNKWSQSGLEAAELAKKFWIRVVANLSLGAYEVYQAAGDLPDPDWPDLNFEEILLIAFKGKYIDTMEHPALRRLRGEI